MAGHVYTVPQVVSYTRSEIMSIGIHLCYFNALSADVYWATRYADVRLAFFYDNGAPGYWELVPSSVGTLTNVLAQVTTATQNINYPAADGLAYDTPTSLMFSGSIRNSQFYVDFYPDKQSAYNAIAGSGGVPIEYLLINATVDGPAAASSGDTVNITITPSAGKVIVDPRQGQSISVYNKDGYINFTYTGGILSFVVP